MWLEDAVGDLVSVRYITRLTTGGSGSDWLVLAKMTVGSDVTLRSGIASQAEAQKAARDMIDSIGE